MISSRFSRSAAGGFTLIELMVVVTIIAILAAIAVPNYSAYVQRSRIIEATSRLADFRVRMEQFFLDNRTYTDGGGKCGIPNPVLAASSSFDLACVPGANNTYTVTATGQAATNMQNFVYTIDQNGAKTTSKVPAGWAVTNGCWVVRKDGSCV